MLNIRLFCTERRARVRRPPPRRHSRPPGGCGAPGGGGGGRGCPGPGRSHPPTVCSAGRSPDGGGHPPVCRSQPAGPGRGRTVCAALRGQRGPPCRGGDHPQTRALAGEPTVLVWLDSSTLRSSDGSHRGRGSSS